MSAPISGSGPKRSQANEEAQRIQEAARRQAAETAQQVAAMGKAVKAADAASSVPGAQLTRTDSFSGDSRDTAPAKAGKKRAPGSVKAEDRESFAGKAADAKGMDSLAALKQKLAEIGNLPSEGASASALPDSAVQPQVKSPQPTADLGSALQQVLGGKAKEAASGRETLKKLALEGQRSTDPVVKNAASAARHVLDGLDLLDKQPRGKMDTFKAVLEFGMAGPDALKAGLEGLKKYGGLDAETTKVLNDMLGSGVKGLKAFTAACQCLDAFGQGNLRDGFKHLADFGESGFGTVRTFMEYAGVDKKKLDAIEGVLKGGKAAVDKVVKGLDHWDKEQYGPALKEFFGAGGTAVQALIPLLSDKAGKYASFFGPLAKSAGEIASVAPQLATMMDEGKPYMDRLDAAQTALSKIGVEVLRPLATKAFGTTAGNYLADGADLIRKQTVEYDQKTGQTWREAIDQDIRAGNHAIQNGEVLAAAMGHKPRSVSAVQKMGTKAQDEYSLMQGFPEFWASKNKVIGKARDDIFDSLRTRGPEAARMLYFDFMAMHRGEHLIQGW